MRPSQQERADDFAALHRAKGIFVVANPWDAGSAKLFEGLGFLALASTSAGCAFSYARADGALSRAQVLDHLTTLCVASKLPISADLENGYGDHPNTVFETIVLAARTGIVGGSIEDKASSGALTSLLDVDLAKERIAAARAAADSVGFTFTLTARAECMLFPDGTIEETIRRLNAYEDAGADVLFAPGLTKQSEIEDVLSSIGKPLNVLMNGASPNLTLDQLGELGVKRVSTGGGLARAAYGAAVLSALDIFERGEFSSLREGFDTQYFNRQFSKGE